MKTSQHKFILWLFSTVELQICKVSLYQWELMRPALQNDFSLGYFLIKWGRSYQNCERQLGQKTARCFPWETVHCSGHCFQGVIWREVCAFAIELFYNSVERNALIEVYKLIYSRSLSPDMQIIFVPWKSSWLLSPLWKKPVIALKWIRSYIPVQLCVFVLTGLSIFLCLWWLVQFPCQLSYMNMWHC